jgi:23S rRNA pseudouridine2605 synthase
MRGGDRRSQPEITSSLGPVRLAKYLAHAGVASRRHAERLITGGRVLVDGRVVTDPARDVDERSNVMVDGSPVLPQAVEYHVVNKPAGVVSTAHDPEGRPKVVDLVESDVRLYPVGRLDVDSTGLVLLTNDGELANRLMHPRYEVPRRYRARVAGTLSKRALQALRSGVELDDGPTRPARVTVVSPPGKESVVEIEIHEGRNRIVRRMLESATPRGPWSGSLSARSRSDACGPATRAGYGPTRWTRCGAPRAWLSERRRREALDFRCGEAADISESE